MCEVLGLKPFTADKPVKDLLGEFNSVLVDYIAAGHFSLYQRIVEGNERRQAVGDWGAFAATHGGLGSGDATLPADVDWTLSITNQWDSSSANSYFRIYGAKLVFMP